MYKVFRNKRTTFRGRIRGLLKTIRKVRMNVTCCETSFAFRCGDVLLSMWRFSRYMFLEFVETLVQIQRLKLDMLNARTWSVPANKNPTSACIEMHASVVPRASSTKVISYVTKRWFLFNSLQLLNAFP
jgi:hypothetical protein